MKSNLELHVDMLRDLEYHGPMQISNLYEKTKIDELTLKKHLEFLVQNGLVEKQSINKVRVLYVITKRGQMLLNLFLQLKNDLESEAYASIKKGIIK